MDAFFILFNMNLIAHRGYKTKYIKENTEEAFNNAVNHNFKGIELDVRRTKDNELVVCHDAFLSRVSNQTGLLKSYTYSELIKFNFEANLNALIGRKPSSINRSWGFPTVFINFFAISSCPP